VLAAAARGRAHGRLGASRGPPGQMSFQDGDSWDAALSEYLRYEDERRLHASSSAA
jgi:hypothetical protein